MTDNSCIVKQLNALIEINNDRIKGYEFAAAELKEAGTNLQAMFHSMASDSKNYAAELTQVVNNLGGQSSTDTTGKGKVYRAWMHVKSNFSGHDRHGIFDSCEYNEEETQEAYQNVLKAETNIDETLRTLIEVQQASLKSAHELIKTFRYLTPQS